MEIYLSRLKLNPRSSNVRRDLGNPQELHKTISAAFPKVEQKASVGISDEAPRSKFSVLHRLEIDRNRGMASLLVQSTVVPDWKLLPSDYSLESECKAVHDQYSRIENGMQLIFRLQANPTKRIGVHYEHPDESKRDEFNLKFRDPNKRRRVSITDEDGQIKWLSRKGEEAGFILNEIRFGETPNVSVLSDSRLEFRKTRDKPKVILGSVLFEGVLSVTDAEKFRLAIANGIGTGKAYGFGLLSIAKGG